MTMENSLMLAVKSALPSLGKDITYNQVARMFLEAGYVSAAGNMYQDGVRLSKYFIVKFNIGHGYCYTFLNGIQLYIWDGTKPKLVSHKSFNCYVWSDQAAREETADMVMSYLRSSCMLLGLGNATDAQLRELSEALVMETERTTALIGCGE